MKKWVAFLFIFSFCLSCQKPNLPSDLSSANSETTDATTLGMDTHGEAVEDGIDYGFWTYQGTYQDEEVSAVGSAELVTTADRSATLARAHAMAKQKVLDAIGHKAIPETIQYTLAYEIVQDLKSQNDVDTFLAQVQSKAQTVRNAAAVVTLFYAKAGVVVAVAEAVNKITGYIRTASSFLGLGHTSVTRAYAVAYTARYKVNIEGMQVVGPGLKAELRNRIDDTYVNEAGKTVTTYNLTWNTLPYKVLLHTGFATYTYDETEMQETPEYAWEISDAKAATALNVFTEIVISAIFNPYSSGSTEYRYDFYNEKTVTGFFYGDPETVYFKSPGSVGPEGGYDLSDYQGASQSGFPHIGYEKTKIVIAYPPEISKYTVEAYKAYYDEILSQRNKALDEIPENIIRQPNTLAFIDTSSVKYYQKAGMCSTATMPPEEPQTYPCAQGLTVSGKIGFKYQYELYTKTVETKSRVGERPNIIAEIVAYFNAHPNQKPRYVKFHEYTGTQLMTYSYEWQNGTLVQVGVNPN